MVTVVFADLAGFTTMAEGRDPEAVKELLDTCFGALVPVIEEHGGTVAFWFRAQCCPSAGLT